MTFFSAESGISGSEAIEELGYGSAADAVDWLQKGGGIREVNDAWALGTWDGHGVMGNFVY